MCLFLVSAENFQSKVTCAYTKLPHKNALVWETGHLVFTKAKKKKPEEKKQVHIATKQKLPPSFVEIWQRT